MLTEQGERILTGNGFGIPLECQKQGHFILKKDLTSVKQAKYDLRDNMEDIP